MELEQTTARPSRPEHRYKDVDVLERFRELVGPLLIGEQDVVTYSWAAGYEKVIVEWRDGGILEYQGVYHPGDGSCEGPGVCRYCGRTLS